MANSTKASASSAKKASDASATATKKESPAADAKEVAASTTTPKESTSTTATPASASTPAPAAASAAAAASPMANSALLKKLPETSNKQTPAPPNSFQAYMEKLDAEKQISYLMLGAAEVLPNFNVKRTHPYSFFFFKKKGYKQIFQPNKNIIVQEIKRRNPEAKPNQNNRSNDELMEMLRERWPLVEPDKGYVLEKEKEYRKVLLSALNPKDVINLDEMTELVASPRSQGLAVPMNGASATAAAPRKRPAGETAAATGSAAKAPAISTLGSVVAGGSGSYYASGNKRRSTGSVGTAASSTTTGLDSSALTQAVNDCAAKLSFANLANIIENLKKERFELQMRKLPLTQKQSSANVQSISMIDNRIKEISDSIVTYEAKMGNGVVKV